MKDDSKILPMTPGIGAALEITKKASEGEPCWGIHKAIVLDEKTRAATCRKCGFSVDAFDYLLAWAKEGERRMRALEDIKVQTKTAQSEHDDLMRRVKNLRATLKRNGHPQSAEERHEYDMRRWNPKNQITVMPAALTSEPKATP